MNTPNSSPLERAARAAYTRPDSSIPWERRTPRRRAYWRTTTRRALDAALDREDLARTLHAAGIQCDTCNYLGPRPYDQCSDCREEAGLFADAIRAHVLAPVVYVVPADDPGRVWGAGYGGGWLDDNTTAEAARTGADQHEDDEDEGVDR